MSGFVCVPVAELELALAAARVSARTDAICSSGLVIGSIERWLSLPQGNEQTDAAYEAGYARAIAMVAEGE